jgi:hypothetical protein
LQEEIASGLKKLNHLRLFLLTAAIQAAVPAAIAVVAGFSFSAERAGITEFLCGFFYM